MLARAVALALAAAACTSVQPLPSASPSPTVLIPTVWRFERTLLRPADPNAYENVLADLVPLRDGGWVAVQLRRPFRFPPSGAFGAQLVRQDGLVLRLDPSGTVIAREHASEPLGIERLIVFEDAGVVVGQGGTVRNGGTHGLDLLTLDGLWTTDASCVAAGGHCFTYRTDARHGSTAIEQHDPRSFDLRSLFPELRMDSAQQPPLVVPERNLFASRRHGRLSGDYVISPLDPARPIDVPWLDRLREACELSIAGPDRIVVGYYFPGCANEATRGRWELTALSSGRVVARYDDYDRPIWTTVGGHDYVGGNTPGSILDPRDGTFGPILPARPLAVDWERGVAAVSLGNGGAAVLRRAAARSDERPLAFTTIGSGRCGTIDVTRVQIADDRIPCPALRDLGGPHRLLLSTGKAPAVEGFAVVAMRIDEATRRITIAYRLDTVRSPYAGTTAPVTVIELPEAVSGSWLVGLEAEPGARSAYGGNTAWAIDLP